MVTVVMRVSHLISLCISLSVEQVLGLVGYPTRPESSRANGCM